MCEASMTPSIGGWNSAIGRHDTTDSHVDKFSGMSSLKQSASSQQAGSNDE
jgi:hypothetical protein